MVAWQTLKTLHAGAVLIAVVDDTGESDGHEGAQANGVVGAIDGDETQHEATATAAVQDLVFSHGPQGKGGH